MAVELQLPAGRKRYIYIAAYTFAAVALLAWYAGILSGEITTLIICLQYFALRMLT